MTARDLKEATFVRIHGTIARAVVQITTAAVTTSKTSADATKRSSTSEIIVQA